MKTITVFLCLLFLMGGSAYGDHTAPDGSEGPRVRQGGGDESSPQGGPRSDRSRGNSRDERRGPPPEAYTACVGKSAGSISQFTDPRGEALTGTCEEENGKMVLRPDKNKGSKQEQARDKAGRSNTIR
ncbi:MAG: hypothetical protein WCQ90_01745 [Deltaproteobacteria bacterium]